MSLLQVTQQRINELNREVADQLAENKRQDEVARQQRIAREQGAIETRAIEQEA